MKHRILKRFSDKVKRLRKSKGWTQEELAVRTGLHRTYIGSIERGERNVSLINVEKIADALGAPVETLVKK